jgi:prepilin-type N-terminal cleavage/methylation domain-containing protein
MNKKGFTLIEIIAVIIVISILLLIAVPSVSRYIEESRQKA